MRLHRFYTTEKIDNQKEVTITSEDMTHQLRRVFRLKTGDRVILFDGSGNDYTCTIADFIGDDQTVFNVQESKTSRFMPKNKLYLFAAVVKKDNFEMIVEKATELGVTDIIPVIAERTEKKAVNEERLQKIVVEASEQSGRGTVPIIHEIETFEEAVKHSTILKSQGTPSIVFHTDAEVFARNEFKNSNGLTVFTGPEGGWSEGEVKVFHENGMLVRSLGSQVLRAETAVVAALSQVVFSL